MMRRFENWVQVCIERGNLYFPGSQYLSDSDILQLFEVVVERHMPGFPLWLTLPQENVRVRIMLGRVALTILNLIQRFAEVDSAKEKIAVLANGEITQVSRLAEVGDTVVTLQDRKRYAVLRPSGRTTSVEQKAQIRDELLHGGLSRLDYLVHDYEQLKAHDGFSGYWARWVEPQVFDWSSAPASQIQDWKFVALGDELHGNVTPHVDSVNGLLWEEYPFYSLRPSIFAIH
jgi:hypothetical protein